MASGPAEEGRRRRIAVPGTILGVGLGGFVDGILLHQILQWHHMLSSAGSDNLGLRPYPPDTLHGLQINTVWDGFFHVICWLAVLLGLWLLYARFTHSRGRIWASRALWGWILVGWGAFNLVEGVIDHHLLGLRDDRRPRHPGPAHVRRTAGPSAGAGRAVTRRRRPHVLRRRPGRTPARLRTPGPLAPAPRSPARDRRSRAGRPLGTGSLGEPTPVAGSTFFRRRSQHATILTGDGRRTIKMASSHRMAGRTCRRSRLPRRTTVAPLWWGVSMQERARRHSSSPPS